MPPLSPTRPVRLRRLEHLSVAARDKAIFATWVEEGKPEGDPGTAENTTLAPEAELEDYDLDEISEPFTPTFSNQERLGNKYRCFILDPNMDDLH